jgi:hypothetical protein
MLGHTGSLLFGDGERPDWRCGLATMGDRLEDAYRRELESLSWADIRWDCIEMVKGGIYLQRSCRREGELQRSARSVVSTADCHRQVFWETQTIDCLQVSFPRTMAADSILISTGQLLFSTWTLGPQTHRYRLPSAGRRRRSAWSGQLLLSQVSRVALLCSVSLLWAIFRP